MHDLSPLHYDDEASLPPWMDEITLARLFEPFQRRERTGDGIGLGLSIVRAIAVAHDADLSAEPLARGGLRVAVSFPSR